MQVACEKAVGEGVGLMECHQYIRQQPLWSDTCPGEKYGYAHLIGLHGTAVSTERAH